MSRNLPPRKDKNRVPRQKRELPAAPKKDAERIAKVVARAGLASRREIEEWITAGRIAVNGVVLETPAVTVTAADVITVDGAPLPERERTRLFLYHKPRGVVTTNKDPEGRTTLFELLPTGLPRLVSVGRLDLNSEGLLLLTNDGGLSRVLELPETGWLRRYRVRAHGDIDQARLDTLMKGITVEGVEYGPIEATLERMQGSNAWVTVSLREGKNREVRNVLGALGLVVNRLIRISYGPFQLNELPEGNIEEVRTRILRDQLGDDLAAAAGADFAGPLVERELEALPPRPAVRMPERPMRGARNRDEAQDEGARGNGPRERRRMSETNELESRGTVADRKGRTVKVERVVSDPNAPPRDFRRGERSEQAGWQDAPWGARPGSGSREDGPRRNSGRFEDDRRGPKRSFGGPREERPAREDFRRDRPRDERGGGERAPRRFDERPRFGGGRNAEGAEGRGRFPDRQRDDRPRGNFNGPREDRPAREDFRRDRPRDERGGGERTPRRFDERPRFGGGRNAEGTEGRGRLPDRQRDDRPRGNFNGPREERPAREDFRRDRPRDERGGGERGPRRFDERPRFGGGRNAEGAEGRGRFPDRQRDDRPRGNFNGPREERPAREDFRRDRPRDERGGGERGPRRFDERPRFGGGRNAEGAEGRGRFPDRQRDDRPRGNFNGPREERPAREDFRRDRPRDERGGGGRSFGDKPYGGKERSERPSGAKPGYGSGRTGAGGSRSGGQRSGEHSGGSKNGGGFKGGGGRGPGSRPGGPRRKD